MIAVGLAMLFSAAPKSCGADIGCIEAATAACAPAVLRIDSPKARMLTGLSASSSRVFEIVGPAGPGACQVVMRSEVGELEIDEKWVLPDGGHPVTEPQRREAAAAVRAEIDDSPNSLLVCEMPRQKIGQYLRDARKGTYDLSLSSTCRSPRCKRLALAEGCKLGECRDGVQHVSCNRVGTSTTCSYDDQLANPVGQEVFCDSSGSPRSVSVKRSGVKQVVTPAAALGKSTRAFEGWAANGTAVVWRIVDIASDPKRPFRVTQMHVETGEGRGRYYAVELAGPDALELEALAGDSGTASLAEYEAWLEDHPLVTKSDAEGASQVRIVATPVKKGLKATITEKDGVYSVKSAGRVRASLEAGGKVRDSFPSGEGPTSLTVTVVVAPGGGRAAVVVSSPTLQNGVPFTRIVKLR